jgi:hypothetical protein
MMNDTVTVQIVAMEAENYSKGEKGEKRCPRALFA